MSKVCFNKLTESLHFIALPSLIGAALFASVCIVSSANAANQFDSAQEYGDLQESHFNAQGVEEHNQDRAYGYMHDTDELNNIPTTAENSLSLGQGNIHIQGVPSKATNSAINIQNGASGIQIKPGSSNMPMSSSYGSMQINGGNSVATNMQINAAQDPNAALQAGNANTANATQSGNVNTANTMQSGNANTANGMLSGHEPNNGMPSGNAAINGMQPSNGSSAEYSGIDPSTMPIESEHYQSGDDLLRPAKPSAIHERLTAQAAAKAEAEAKAKAFAEFMGKNSGQSTDLNTYASNGSHSMGPSHARAIDDQSSSAADLMMDSGANYGVPAMRRTIQDPVTLAPIAMSSNGIPSPRNVVDNAIASIDRAAAQAAMSVSSVNAKAALQAAFASNAQAASENAASMSLSLASNTSSNNLLAPSDNYANTNQLSANGTASPNTTTQLSANGTVSPDTYTKQVSANTLSTNEARAPESHEPTIAEAYAERNAAFAQQFQSNNNANGQTQGTKNALEKNHSANSALGSDAVDQAYSQATQDFLNSPSESSNVESPVNEAGLLKNKSDMACIELSHNTQVPMYIRHNQCFELQGGNVIATPVTVRGKLFVKAGRNIVLQSGSSITVAPGGFFEVRGDLNMMPKTALNIDDKAALTCSGLINMMGGAVINTRGDNQIRNIGRFFIEPGAYISMAGDTKMRNSGLITMNQSNIAFQNNGLFENAGTIKLENGSMLAFKNKSKLTNIGKIDLDKNSALALSGYAKFLNRRMFTPDGKLFFEQNSIFENAAAFRQHQSSEMQLKNSAQIINNHTMDMSGKALFTGNARILNEGTFAVKKSANVHTRQRALMINTGTFRNEGGGFTVDSQSNFINENIVSGRESRTQGRHRL